MLEVLPFGDPVVGNGAAAVGALVEVGQGFVEVVGVDVGENLPEDLAIFELVPGADPAGEVERVDLRGTIVRLCLWLQARGDACVPSRGALSAAPA